jgi:hypothetical protein
MSESKKPNSSLYPDGSPVEFYDSSTHSWVKGTVYHTRFMQGYLVYVSINYWAFGKQRNIKIYNTDWVRNSESKVRLEEAIASSGQA